MNTRKLLVSVLMFVSVLFSSCAPAVTELALYRFSTTMEAGSGFVSHNWNLIFAHVVLTSLPIMIVYLIGQRRIISGLTEGGVKG